MTETEGETEVGRGFTVTPPPPQSKHVVGRGLERRHDWCQGLHHCPLCSKWLGLLGMRGDWQVPLLEG